MPSVFAATWSACRATDASSSASTSAASARPPAAAISRTTRSSFADGAPGEEHPRPLAREGARRGAADRAAAAIDHRVLALEQHGQVQFFCIDFAISCIAFCASSMLTSRTGVATDQWWPNGSSSLP